MGLVTFEKRGRIGIFRIRDEKGLQILSEENRSGIISEITNIVSGLDLSGLDYFVTMGTEKAFSVGADLRQIRDCLTVLFHGDEKPIRLLLQKFHQFVKWFHNFPRPTIAIMRNAFGGGLELALGHRVRFGIAGSVVGFPEAEYGMLPGAGGTVYSYKHLDFVDYVRLVEESRKIYIEEAAILGLVDHIYFDEADALSYLEKIPLSSLKPLLDRVSICSDEETEKEIDFFIKRVKDNGVINVISKIDAYFASRKKKAETSNVGHYMTDEY